MSDAVPPRTPPSGTSSDSLRVKLRLYYGGKFVPKAPGAAEWRYVGGSCFNDAVPSTFRYSDLARKLNDKFCDTVSFKYNSPGEELDPDALVAVTDDDDLEELFEEYFAALRRPGTPLKTFRVKVYVFPALQFETMYAAPGTEDVDASAYDGQEEEGEGSARGINFESWCSDEASHESSQPSCGFGVAAELQASADNAFLQALHQQATTLPHQHVSPFPPHPLCVPNGLTPSSHYAAAFPQHAAAGATPQSGLHVHIPSQQHLLANGLGYSSQQATTPQQQTPGGIDANAGLEGLGLLHNLAVTPPVHISPTLDATQVPTPRAAGAWMPRLEHHALDNISKSMQSRHFLRCGSGEKSAEQGHAVFMPSQNGSATYLNSNTNQGSWGLGGAALQQPYPAAAPTPTATAATRNQKPPTPTPTPTATAATRNGTPPPLPEQQEARLQNLFDVAGYPRRGFTADDFTLDDPYHEDGGSLNGTPVHLRQQQQQQENDDSQLPYQAERERQLWMDLMSDRGEHSANGGKAVPRAQNSAANLALHIRQLGQASLLGGGSTGSGSANAAGGHAAAARTSGDRCAPPGSNNNNSNSNSNSNNNNHRDNNNNGSSHGSSSQHAHGTNSGRAALVGGDAREGGVHDQAKNNRSSGNIKGMGEDGEARAEDSFRGGAQSAHRGNSSAYMQDVGAALQMGGGKGSMKMQSVGGWTMGGGEGLVDLPSHISAFGEGLEEEEQQGCDLEEAREAERQRLQLLYGDIDVSSNENPQLGSKCITQDFSDQEAGRFPSQEAGKEQQRFAKPPAVSVNMQDSSDQLGSSPLMMPKNLLANVTQVPQDQVVVTHKLGEGAFGEVSRAEVFPYGTVAIKWLKRERFTKHSQSFMREAEVLARLNHPNIIRMFGLVTEPSPAVTPGRGSIIAGIMMEHVRGGSLSQRLRARAHAGQPFTLRERCHIALQAALGMAYLHDQHPAVIHFDLKPDNLLVEREGQDVLVKVADFGLAKSKFAAFVTCHDLRGTLPYMAPELVANPTQVCEKCDVWSMGVVMWEMWTLKVPFNELSAQQILVGLMHGTLHLPLSRSCEPEWSHLIKSCMEPDPLHRPSFKQLSSQIKSMMVQGLCDPPIQSASHQEGAFVRSNGNNAVGAY